MNQILMSKIQMGYSLTDDELDLALEFFRDLQLSLSVLRPTFDLAWFEANRILTKLEGFKFHRSHNF